MKCGNAIDAQRALQLDLALLDSGSQREVFIDEGRRFVYKVERAYGANEDEHKLFRFMRRIPALRRYTPHSTLYPNGVLSMPYYPEAVSRYDKVYDEFYALISEVLDIPLLDAGDFNCAMTSRGMLRFIDGGEGVHKFIVEWAIENGYEMFVGGEDD